MLKKLSLLAGFGAGYVLGAKAGTERYDQIVAKARELAGQPQVQQATATVQDTASGLADKAKETVNEKVSTVSDKVESKKSGGKDSVVDLGTGTGSGAKTGATAPMAGASASITAPDITRP